MNGLEILSSRSRRLPSWSTPSLLDAISWVHQIAIGLKPHSYNDTLGTIPPVVNDESGTKSLVMLETDFFS